MANRHEWAALLRETREASGLSQEDLAERLGHTQGWAQKIESARSGVRVETAQEWLRACGSDLTVPGRSVEQAGLDDEAAWLVRQLAAVLRAGLAPAHRVTLRLQLEGWPVGESDQAALLAAEISDVVQRYKP